MSANCVDVDAKSNPVLVALTVGTSDEICALWRNLIRIRAGRRALHPMRYDLLRDFLWASL